LFHYVFIEVVEIAVSNLSCLIVIERIEIYSKLVSSRVVVKYFMDE